MSAFAHLDTVSAPRPSLPLRFELPFPPTVNTYWRSIVIKGRVRVLVSRDGEAYANTVKWRLIEWGLHKRMLQGRLAVVIDAYPPDRRARDLDNLPKGLLDSITKAGLWPDDSVIDLLTIRRRPSAGKPGKVIVTIAEADDPASMGLAA